MARSSAVVRCSERRTQPRFAGERIQASVRIPGRWRRIGVSVIDFNRHGMSILSQQRLVAPKGLQLTLELDDLKISGVHGVIHNCRPAPGDGTGGFRLGIQFRPDCTGQFDRAEAKRILRAMERIARSV